MLRRQIIAAALSFSLLAPVALRAQAANSQTSAAAGAAPARASQSSAVYRAPDEIIARIREEGMGKNSQVMQTLSYLTDVIGGRLTNSPQMKRANLWTRDQLSKWGLANARLEAWGPFGRGWSLRSFSAQVTSPQVFPVIAYPKAWSPNASVSNAEVIYLDAETKSDLEKYRGRLKGKVVLVSAPRELKANFAAFGKRLTDEQLAKLAGAPDPAKQQSNGLPPAAVSHYLEQLDFEAKRMQFVMSEGGALMVDNSFGGDGGTVFVQEAAVAHPTTPTDLLDVFGDKRLQPWHKEAESKMVPQMTMATEDYNRLVRMLAQNEPLKMTVDLQAQYHDEDMMGYNTVAEIPGTDPALKEEIVMLGGHMDSWHSSTGATDNAAGVAVTMEAVRIIQSLGLKPRRTVRIALWSGEEQGLYGSIAYVSQHFGTRGDAMRSMIAEMIGRKLQPPQLVKKPAYEKLSAYFNLDNGTGKIRGVYMQGNAAVRPIFEAWLAPFKDVGATTLTLSNTSGTDHLAFDAVGLPGFQFIQDEVEYNSRTHHSNQDNYDRIQADDMRQAATVMAAFVYQTAMMDEKMPRKPMTP